MTDMLESVTRIIQVALTPVFLLSAIGALLNVFSTRLGRVSDRVDALSREVAAADPAHATRLAAQLAYLRRRSWLLDIAVVLAAVGGGFTCLAALVLFLGALRDTTVVSVLFTFFGLSILCTLAAIFTFVWELLVAGRGLREEVDVRQVQAAAQATPDREPV